MGSGEIHPRSLEEMAGVIVRLFGIIHAKSQCLRELLENWKNAIVTPFLQSSKKYPGKYNNQESIVELVHSNLLCFSSQFSIPSFGKQKERCLSIQTI